MSYNDYLKSLKSKPAIDIRSIYRGSATIIQESYQTYTFETSYSDAIKYLIKERNSHNAIIPKEFIQYAKSIHFKGFIYSAYEYFKELQRLELKKTQIREEAIKRKMPMPPFIESESKILHAKAIEMSTKYAWIIFKLPKRKKSQLQEKLFFETLMFFCAKVLVGGFPTEFEEELTKELNRLFRNNAFNSIERKQRRISSIFSSGSKKESVDKYVERVSTASTTTKKGLQRRETFDELKPKYSDDKSIMVMHCRSPLISVLFPDMKCRARAKSLMTKKYSNIKIL